MNYNLKTKSIDVSMMVYCSAFLIYSLIGRIIPLNNLISNKINGLIYILFAGIGVLLIIGEIIVKRRIFTGVNNVLLYLFIGVMTISSFINTKYGIGDNIKTIVWTIIQVYIYYNLYKRINKDMAYKWLFIVFNIIITIWIIALLYSFKQYLFQESYIQVVNNIHKRQGFMDNRLFGVFNDPNYAAITSIYLIFATIFCFKRSNYKVLKGFYIFNIIISIIYIILSGSRTSEICALVSGIICTFIMFKSKYKSHTYIKSLFMTLLCLSIVILVHGPVKNLLSVLPDCFMNGNNITLDKKDEDILERPDVDNDNISNNRFAIWKGYIYGIKGRYLLGVSPRNGLQYVKEHDSNGYIAKTNYETHNGYLSVFVATGIVGLSIIIIFMLYILKRIFVYIHTNKIIELEFIVILGIIVTLAIYTFFFTELFFANNLTTAIFWPLLGFLNYYGDEKKIQK